METTCLIVGGGPAGAVLGLLLARAGIAVTVLEKHGDFLRDFRGDTVHPSTLDILDELGLGPRFAELPQHRAERLSLVTDQGEAVVGELGLLRGRHRYLAFVPQWDLLDLITTEAARHPGFRLLMNAEAYELVREGAEVVGVRYRDEKGEDQEIRALLTVAADGRGSVLRKAAGLAVREFGAPMDVAWFRLPHAGGDPREPFLRLGVGRLLVAIARETHWQLGFVVPKGASVELPELRRDVAAMLPFLADRADQIEEVSMLQVRVNRLRTWHRPGLLCIGDAAHAMSPVLGVGINLAVQDAVAAANLLYGPLKRGTITPQDLAKVQRRRRLPTAAIQRLQLVVQAGFIGPALRGKVESKPPAALKLLRHIRPLRRLVITLIAHGLRPEHVHTPDASRSQDRLRPAPEHTPTTRRSRVEDRPRP